MDFATLIILAGVQGVTEFLPVSSSAHVVFAAHLLADADDVVLIAILLHGATLVALVAHFWGDIRSLLRGVRAGRPEDAAYVRALVIAAVPVFILGAVAYDVVTSLDSPTVVAASLMVSGLLLFVADRSARRGGGKGTSLKKKGLRIGLMQALALIPGVSRSGITMTAGRFVGFSRREAVRFSFLLAVPVIAGAVVWSVVSSADDIGGSIAASPVALVAAMTVAFLTALGTIRWLLRTIERISFTPFCIYQAGLGALILILV